MLGRFSTRLVVGVFGGAALGLAVAWVLRLLFGFPSNIFWGMVWGIFALSIFTGLHNALSQTSSRASVDTQAPRDRNAA
jgi:hypothetical protein